MSKNIKNEKLLNNIKGLVIKKEDLNESSGSNKLEKIYLKGLNVR